MNAAHFHLVVNHLPIVFPLVGVLVMIFGLVLKSEEVKKTALFVFAIGAITAFVAMNSGDRAEDVVENLVGVSQSLIEKHEESAELFAVLSYILGGISIFGIWAMWKQKAFARTLHLSALLFALVIMFFAKDAATTGGEIRHPEIRSEAAAAGLNSESGEEHD